MTSPGSYPGPSTTSTGYPTQSGNGHSTSIEHVAKALGGAVRTGAGWDCRCPCHDDTHASLSLSVGDKQPLLVHCHAGCAQADVLAELRKRGLAPERRPRHPGAGRRIAATYDYVDEHGVVLFQVVRFDPKDFRQRLPDGTWKLGNTRRVLYRLPEVLAADEVVVVEGEKAADRLAALGVAATCSPGGADKWRKAYAQALKGKAVLVLPDNDKPGRKHAADVAASLARVAKSVRVLELPDLPEKGDVADWLEAGHTIGELISLARVTRAHEKTADPSPETAPRARDARARDARAEWTAWWPVLKGKDGAPVEANVEWALQQAPELAGRLRLNLFTNNIEIMDPPWRPGSGWTTWADVEPGRLASWLQRKGLLVKPGVCRTAAVSIAHDTPHDPVRLYLEGLRWDGTERLSTWLTTHLGADRSTPELARYLTAVGRKWLISAVARTFSPGEKADHMLILEGPQGARKSTALAALVPEPSWFADELATIGTKDADQDLRGKLIIEVAELSAMHRSDVERVKAFLSRKADHYRPSYAMHSADFPRRCVFAGSTNAEAYLLDDTGNRRFWGVKVGKIDVDAIKRDRDQLWAEAVHAFLAGEKWHLEQAEENIAAGEQEKRRQVDPWEDHVRTWLKGKTECTVNDVLSNAVQVPRERQNRAAQMNAARALKAAGWERFQHHEDGVRSWRYRPAWAAPTDPTPENEDGAQISPVPPTGSPSAPTSPTCFDDVPRRRARDARHARTHHETGSESVGEVGVVGSGVENTGEIPPRQHQPPPTPTWAADWPTWDGRCGADPDCIKEWVALAGGGCSRRAVTLPAACRLYPEALKRLLGHITLQAWKVDWT